MKRDTAYTLFDCGCHPMVSIVAPTCDGERHIVSFSRWDDERDDVHQLVARDGKWEIAK